MLGMLISDAQTVWAGVGNIEKRMPIGSVAACGLSVDRQ
jgi:hypothetical protein